MLKLPKINPFVRATGVIGATAALVTGVTFAALNSQATLTSNTISSATAGLEVGMVSNDTGSSRQGFTITGLVPGHGVDETFYAKNTGDTPLSLTVTMPTLPPAPTGGYGFTGFGNLKVDISTVGTTCTDVAHTDMATLNTPGNVALPCGPVAAGVTQQYTAHFDILPAAVTGSTAGVGSFDLVFTGTQG